MKSVTIREAQHGLPRLLREVEGGRVIEIRRRKEAVATLMPLNRPRTAASWSDHRRRFEAVWAGNQIDVLDETLADLRSED